MIQLLNFTSEALAQAARFSQENPDFSGKPLRVYLSGKGCDGFEYGVTFDTQEPGDASFMVEHLTVVIDAETLKFVKGSTVEWVDDERGKGFLVTNPNHKLFRGKFFKRAGWQERLLKDKTPPEASQ